MGFSNRAKKFTEPNYLDVDSPLENLGGTSAAHPVWIFKAATPHHTRIAPIDNSGVGVLKIH